MNAKGIKTDAEHAIALARIDELFAAKPGTPEGDELELLTLLADEYENAMMPIGLPTPAAAIQFRVNQKGTKEQGFDPVPPGFVEVGEAEQDVEC